MWIFLGIIASIILWLPEVPSKDMLKHEVSKLKSRLAESEELNEELVKELNDIQYKNNTKIQ